MEGTSSLQSVFIHETGGMTMVTKRVLIEVEYNDRLYEEGGDDLHTRVVRDIKKLLDVGLSMHKDGGIGVTGWGILLSDLEIARPSRRDSCAACDQESKGLDEHEWTHTYGPDCTATPPTARPVEKESVGKDVRALRVEITGSADHYQHGDLEMMVHRAIENEELTGVTGVTVQQIPLDARPADEESDDTRCACGHTKGEHVVAIWRTSNGSCWGRDANGVDRCSCTHFKPSLGVTSDARPASENEEKKPEKETRVFTLKVGGVDGLNDQILQNLILHAVHTRLNVNQHSQALVEVIGPILDARPAEKKTETETVWQCNMCGTEWAYQGDVESECPKCKRRSHCRDNLLTRAIGDAHPSGDVYTKDLCVEAGCDAYRVEGQNRCRDHEIDAPARPVKGKTSKGKTRELRVMMNGVDFMSDRELCNSVRAVISSGMVLPKGGDISVGMMVARPAVKDVEEDEMASHLRKTREGLHWLDTLSYVDKEQWKALRQVVMWLHASVAELDSRLSKGEKEED